MVKFDNVSYSYDGIGNALDGISLSIKTGERVGLIGANGSGKSTLMRSCLGLLDADGLIIIDGMKLDRKNMADIRKTVGYVIQDADNQMFMPTVYEDMLFGLLNYKTDREEADRIIDSVLAQLNLMHLKNRHNHKMSGGEKKMAAIAVILAMQPKVMLLDEPSSTLDSYNRRTLINILNSISVTKIIATHDLDMVLDTCDRVILMNDGRITADGDTAVILKDKKLLESNRLELPLRYQ